MARIPVFKSRPFPFHLGPVLKVKFGLFFQGPLQPPVVGRYLEKVVVSCQQIQPGLNGFRAGFDILGKRFNRQGRAFPMRQKTGQKLHLGK
jgi:hypothetical protein